LPLREAEAISDQPEHSESTPPPSQDEAVVSGESFADIPSDKPVDAGFNSEPPLPPAPAVEVFASHESRTPDTAMADDITSDIKIPGVFDTFAPEPPFRPRRNPARMWTTAAIIFFLLVSAAGAALYVFGAPNWAVNLGLAPDNEEPDLLFYLAKPAERRKLPTGEEYFAFSARIVNSGEAAQAVPPVLVELRDKQGRLVFSWTTKADKGKLKPGEEASINESRLDIPKNAENLSLGFVDSSR